MDVEGFLKDSFFKGIKTTLRNCWFPGEGCNSKSIKAHSIQNSRVLEMLSLDGHVIMPQEKITHKGEVFLVGFAEIGRNEASTFTGLCGKHDKEIFSPIDDFEINFKDNQQLFLLAYRAILKKTHLLVSDLAKIEKIHRDQVKVGRATNDLSNPLFKAFSQQFIRARGAYLYKQIYDAAYLTQQYQVVHHNYFSVRHKKPSIAVSALYWVGGPKSNGTQVPWIALNVFPTNDETHVIFSHLESDAEYVSSEIEDIFNMSIKRRLWQVSERVISASENFVVSPTFWNRLSKKKRNAIISYYSDTLVDEKSFNGDPRDLCLFELYGKK
jgi:hypothetical protein